MRKVPLGPGWHPWPSTLRSIGYSFYREDRRADVGRMMNPETDTIEWCAKSWLPVPDFDATVELVFTGQDLHSAITLAEGS